MTARSQGLTQLLCFHNPKAAKGYPLLSSTQPTIDGRRMGVTNQQHRCGLVAANDSRGVRGRMYGVSYSHVEVV
jgi:hypothetical protein